MDVPCFSLLSIIAFLTATIASPAGAPVPSSIASALASANAAFSANQGGLNITASSTSLSVLTTAAPALPSNAIQLAGKQTIPGAWSTFCNENDGLPCIAYCSSADTACQSAGSAATSTCGPQWEEYWSIWHGEIPTPSGWINVASSTGQPAQVMTTTIQSYTSFSTASESFVKAGKTSGQVTITPVYALGSPVKIETVTTLPDNRTTWTVLSGPKPSCSFSSMWVQDPEDCGKCTLTGGTVDLYFWPPATASAKEQAPMSTVLSGSTLVSPSVYIHLSTVFAENSCSVVGQQHTATLIAMDPAEISTQIHVGGKVAAYDYAPLDYADLTGLPPASEYQMQPSCVMFGCPTMYSTTFFPTLKVPSQIRSIDPAWAECVLGLEGLYVRPTMLSGGYAKVDRYDPPVALQPRSVAVSATQPIAVRTTSASPSATQHVVETTSILADEPVQATATRAPATNNPSSTAAGSLDPSTGLPSSTITLERTSTVITDTRVVSVDYGTSSVATTPDASTVPDPLLDATPLKNGVGVMIEGQTLRFGHHAITLGSGDDKTTLSLEFHDRTLAVLDYGTSTAVVLDPPRRTRTPQAAAQSPTATEASGPRSKHSMAAPAEASAVPPDELIHPVPVSSGSGVVVDSQTLRFGERVTLGAGHEKTTLSLEVRSSSVTLLDYGTSVAVVIRPDPMSSTPEQTRSSLAYNGTTIGNAPTPSTGRSGLPSITHASTSGSSLMATTSMKTYPGLQPPSTSAPPPTSTSAGVRVASTILWFLGLVLALLVAV